MFSSRTWTGWNGQFGFGLTPLRISDSGGPGGHWHWVLSLVTHAEGTAEIVSSSKVN